ncbi:MAG: hypothetical protein ACO1RT_17825 [Planctomycetaceae bacterium]
MIPATNQRVANSTSDEVNEQIRLEMEQRLAHYRYASPHAIQSRLRELDQEWDTERTLEANAATIAFTGSVLAATVDRRWAYLPMLVSAFLFQHAIQGWCPPLPIIRRLGVRTMSEIEEERRALEDLLAAKTSAAHSPSLAASGHVV